MINKTNKKASLSLSVNAIVVLVIGITVLGLSLAFTRGMFGSLSQNLVVPEPNYPATAREPIVLPADTIEAKASKDLVMTVNFYNDYAESTWAPKMECDGLELTDNLIVGAQTVEPGEYKGFKFIIKRDTFASAESGYYLCTISFEDENSHKVTKQITINLK